MHRVYSRNQIENNYVVVDWNLGNRCTMQCSYCHPEFRSGNKPFPAFDKAILFVDRVHEKHRELNSNRVISFSFVGGEPTEYLSLPALCQHIKTYFSLVRVMSNGAASQSYWEELSPHIDTASLTHHEGRIDFDHFLRVCETLRKHGKNVEIQFAMQPDSFDVSLTKLRRIEALGFHPVLQALYRDHASRRQIMPYTAGQIAILFPKVETGDVVIEGTERNEYADTGAVIHRRANSFTGMKCGIGTDQLCVSPDGSIRGGWCRVGGVLGNIHSGDFVPPAAPITCTKSTCDNPLDLAVPKWLD